MPKVIRQNYIKENNPRKRKLPHDAKMCCGNCHSENFCKINVKSDGKITREYDKKNNERRRGDCTGFKLRKEIKPEV